MNPSLSVVVVTHNSAGTLSRCLESLRTGLPEAEMVVVDNASADASREVATSFSGVRLLTQNANAGFGRACNAGVEAASGTHLLFLNPDAELRQVDQAAMASILAQPRLGLGAPAIAEAGAPRSDVAKPLLHPCTHWSRDLWRLTFGQLRPRELSPRIPRRSRGACRWASGAAILVRRSEFIEVGGFNPDFFLFYEDRELSDRYTRAGLPIRPIPELQFAHRRHEHQHTRALDEWRLGWCLLGLVEYTSLRWGQNQAESALRLGMAALRAIQLALAIPARLPGAARARRKRELLRGLGRFLARIRQESLPSEAEAGHCPRARLALARLPRPLRLAAAEPG